MVRHSKYTIHNLSRAISLSIGGHNREMPNTGLREYIKSVLGGKKSKRTMGIPQFNEGEGTGIQKSVKVT